MAVKKMRTLYEGPEWDESRRKLDPNLPRFDEAFRWTAFNIATEPYTNSTAFLDDDFRIMRWSVPGVAEVWVYFQIDPGGESCTLLWIASKGDQIIFRVG